MKGMPKNKRHMREMQQQDPIKPVRHKPGSKPARKAAKFAGEMARKHSKEDLKAAAKHMMEHQR